MISADFFSKNLLAGDVVSPKLYGPYTLNDENKHRVNDQSSKWASVRLCGSAASVFVRSFLSSKLRLAPWR